MHHRAYHLPRISLPRNRVNRVKKWKGASLLQCPGQMSLVTRLHTFLLARLRNETQLLHHL
jgi:hypothetical protein